MKTAISILTGSAFAIAVWSGGAARAAQTTMTISMAAPPAAARIQPPFVIGAQPGKPVLFTVPATGQAPLAFTASGLPAGLMLAGSTGLVTGTAPAAGSYPFTVTVTNAAGAATANMTLMSGSNLNPTPALGWNSYDCYGASINESEVMAQAQAIKSTLQPFGWHYVVIDYRWYEPNQPTDTNGRYLPAPSKYPSATGSNGFKTLSDAVHALGLGFGIHIMRGVPRKSYTANNTIAGSSYTTQEAGNSADTCPWDDHMYGVRGDTAAGQAWYDSILAQYASWGIDFVKIDDMLNNTTKQYHQAEANALRMAADKTGRAIALSFSPGPDDPSWLPSSVANLNTNAQMWRVVDDFWDVAAITDLPGVFRAAGTWQGTSGLVQGHYPDFDMLPLGFLGPRVEWGGHANNVDTAFTHNEQVAIMSLWGIAPSPLIFGGNPQSLTTRASSGPWTTALLTNEEVLAVNQDSMGTHAKRISQQGSTEVWARDLSGGRKAVALFNRGTQDATVSVTFSQLGVTGTPAVRDLWQRANVTGMTTGVSVNVAYGGAQMYTLSSPGTGGSGGAAGTVGSGGTGGSGGSTGGGAGAAAAGRGGSGAVAGASGASGGAGGRGGTAGSAAGASGSGGGAAGTAAIAGNNGTAGSVAGTGGGAGAAGGITGAAGTNGAAGTTSTGAAGTSSTGTAGRGGSGSAATGGSGSSDPGGCACSTARLQREPAGLAFWLTWLTWLTLAVALRMRVSRRRSR